MTFFSRSMSSSANSGLQIEVGEDVDGERQVLVEHLEVIAGVFLRREGVDLAADRIHLLRDFFRAPCRRALEQHVLDEVGDARVSAGSWREPRVSQMPIGDRRTCGIRSVARRTPLASTARRILDSDTWGPAAD